MIILYAHELAGEYRGGLRELGKLKAQLLGMQNLTRPRVIQPGAPWRPPEPLRFLASTRGMTGRSVPAAEAAIKAGENAAREYLDRLRADPEAVPE